MIDNDSKQSGADIVSRGLPQIGRQLYVFSGPPRHSRTRKFYIYLCSITMYSGPRTQVGPGARDTVDTRYRKGLSGVHEVVTSLSHFQEASLHIPTLRSSSDI